MNNVTYKVYKITNVETGMCYIGQTIRPLSVRWGRHKYDAKTGTNTFLYRSMRKYGEDSFKIKTIACALKRCQLNDLEIALIAQYKTLCPGGYNLTSGGDSKTKIADETRKKLSIAGAGRKHTEEAKKKMSISKMGNKNGLGNKSRAGHIISEVTREKIRIASTGRRHTEESKEKISKGRMGIDNPTSRGLLHTPFGVFNSIPETFKATKVPRSAITKRCNSKSAEWLEWYFEKPPICAHTDEAKRKISEGRLGINNPASRGLIFTPNGSFESIKEAGLYFSLEGSTISSRCNNTKDKWKDWYFEKPKRVKGNY